MTEPPRKKRVCPYLDTVDRTALDFDKEKICCKTLRTTNIYCCLVCGDYFQGRGIGTPAHIHSLEDNHHIFINTQTRLIYDLPIDELIDDSSFSDIQSALDPIYTQQQINSIDINEIQPVDKFNHTYIPGFIGINNLGQDDYINVIIQIISHIPAIRNIFLQGNNYITSILKDSKHPEVVLRLSEVIRKLWNPKTLKAHVSPYELISEITRASDRKFTVEKRVDCIDFLLWIISLLGSIGDCIKGEMIVKCEGKEEKKPIRVKKVFEYKFWTLPTYLIFVVKRFSKSTLIGEKNVTIVEFDYNLDMAPYLHIDAPSQSTQFVLLSKYFSLYLFYRYTLLSSVKHIGNPETGSYSTYLYCKPHNKWVEINDLEVHDALLPLIKVSDTYILVYQQS
ncbi:Pre-mRNA-splicing factor SAD1 [Entamoeba marina]